MSDSPIGRNSSPGFGSSFLSHRTASEGPSSSGSRRHLNRDPSRPTSSEPADFAKFLQLLDNNESRSILVDMFVPTSIANVPGEEAGFLPDGLAAIYLTWCRHNQARDLTPHTTTFQPLVVDLFDIPGSEIWPINCPQLVDHPSAFPQSQNDIEELWSAVNNLFMIALELLASILAAGTHGFGTEAYHVESVFQRILLRLPGFKKFFDHVSRSSIVAYTLCGPPIAYSDHHDMIMWNFDTSAMQNFPFARLMAREVELFWKSVRGYVFLQMRKETVRQMRLYATIGDTVLKIPGDDSADDISKEAQQVLTLLCSLELKEAKPTSHLFVSRCIRTLTRALARILGDGNLSRGIYTNTMTATQPGNVNIPATFMTLPATFLISALHDRLNSSPPLHINAQARLNTSAFHCTPTITVAARRGLYILESDAWVSIRGLLASKVHPLGVDPAFKDVIAEATRSYQSGFVLHGYVGACAAIRYP